MCHTYTTPRISNFYEEFVHHADDEVVESKKYCNMNGSPHFVARKSRPDITLAVNILDQYSMKPSLFLVKYITEVFGYLSLTLESSYSSIGGANVTKWSLCAANEILEGFKLCANLDLDG